MTPSPQKSVQRDELIGRLLNEDVDAAGRKQLNELLVGDIEAQKWYLQCLDLEVVVRRHAHSLDDEDFALREAQAALDTLSAACNSDSQASVGDGTQALPGAGMDDSAASIMPLAGQPGKFRWRALRPLLWTTAAALLLVGFSLLSDREQSTKDTETSTLASAPTEPAPIVRYGVAQLTGAVAARWAGAKLELPEGQLFEKGERLQLVEGLAEIMFDNGTHVVVQGPAILQFRDINCLWVSVGRIAANVPRADDPFTVQTLTADLRSRGTEFGAEIDVDGSLAIQVFNGDVDMQMNRDEVPTTTSRLAGGHALRIDALSGRVGPLTQPNGLRLVRYLPSHEMLINLAAVVAGGDGLGDGTRKAYHRGISLVDGRPIDQYGAPVESDGQYHKAQGVQFIDGVFIPDGKRSPEQVDSIGRLFSDFPATAGDCWGGAIMARCPKEEQSLPSIRLEFHGDNYGYVNWLHVASKPEELSPQGHGLIGMHSNCGITFDLHAIRARHPNKTMVRFRALVGNLESKLESYAADAWVIVDGKLRYHRKEFSREEGPERIDVPLTDRDRFLVLVVTDAGAKTAYDWVAFGDPVIELTNHNGFTGAAFWQQRPRTPGDDQSLHLLPQLDARADRGRAAAVESSTAWLGGKNPLPSDGSSIVQRLVAAGSHYSISLLAGRSAGKIGDARCQSECGRSRLAP